MASACAEPHHPEVENVAKNADVRLSTTLRTHPKMTKLHRRLGGPAGPLAIIYLWAFAAAEKPDGDLSGMSDEDIEIAAGWDGAPGAFVAAAAEVRFLDGGPGEYRLHDWAEHQPWVVGAEDRSESAKWAALCKRYGRDGAAERMPDYAARMRPARDPDAPRTRPASDSQPDPVRTGCPVSFTDTDTDTESPPIPPAPAPKRTRKARPAVGAEEYPQGFVRFWDAYPAGKRSKKVEAAAVWKRDELEDYADTIVRDVQDRKTRHWGWIKEGGAFIPGAQVYLNGRRWNDDIEPPPAGGGGGRRSATEYANAQRARDWAGGA